MKKAYAKNLDGIAAMILEAGIDEDNVGEVYTERHKFGTNKTNTYYNFKIYELDVEDFFRFGSMLGQTFGDENIWIDTYSATSKYRGYAKIEIKK